MLLRTLRARFCSYQIDVKVETEREQTTDNQRKLSSFGNASHRFIPPRQLRRGPLVHLTHFDNTSTSPDH